MARRRKKSSRKSQPQPDPRSEKQPKKKEPRALAGTPLLGIVRDNVRNLRHLRGWNQRQLADAIGVSQPYVSAIESATTVNARKVHIDLLYEVAAALGSTPADLVTPGRYRLDGQRSA